MSATLPWYVYVVANHSRQEIYVGVERDSGTPTQPAGWEECVGDRWRELCQQALPDWDCRTDQLHFVCSIKRPDCNEAADLMNEMRRGLDLRTHCPTAAVLVRDGYVLLGPTPHGVD